MANKNAEKLRAELNEKLLTWNYFKRRENMLNTMDLIELISIHRDEFPLLYEYSTGKTQKEMAEDRGLTSVNAKFHKEKRKFPLALARWLKPRELNKWQDDLFPIDEDSYILDFVDYIPLPEKLCITKLHRIVHSNSWVRDAGYPELADKSQTIMGVEKILPLIERKEVKMPGGIGPKVCGYIREYINTIKAMSKKYEGK